MTEPTDFDTTAVDKTAVDKRALLASRLRRRIADTDHPLSYPQQRLWFLDQLDPGNPVYVVPLTYRVDGPLSVPALETALTGLVHRHHVLRTVFRSVDDMPRQFVQPAGPVTVPIQDVSAQDDPAAAAEALSREEAHRPFDLATDPMIRPLLLRLAPEEHRLYLTMHHIACDGASLGILGAELSQLYRAALAGDEPNLADLP